jgi:hypothetical protein
MLTRRSLFYSLLVLVVQLVIEGPLITGGLVLLGYLLPELLLDNLLPETLVKFLDFLLGTALVGSENIYGLGLVSS